MKLLALIETPLGVLNAFMNVADPEGCAAEALEGLRLGFDGKLVNQRQVALVH